MGNSTKELVKAFNLNNYFSDKINANFTVEGKKIVGLFASGTNIGEYLQEIGEEIIERHYLSGTEVAGAFYNLNCFPFVLGANANKEDLGNGIVKVKLAGSMDPEVIHNLKIHFANEFERAVISTVVARLQKAGVMEEEAYEWIRGTVKTGAIGSPYLYCIAFSDEYLKRKYDSETFEVLEGMYIQEFNSRLKECHVKSSDFYEYKDDMLCIKDVSDKVVKSVTEHVKKEIAFYFITPGKEDSKVENFKDVLSSLMSKHVRKSINVYDYDTFTDENKIKNGHNFALIPFIEMGDGQYETLSFNDARNIYRTFNGKINKAVPNGFFPKDYDIISDIRGKTASSQFANCKEPVYAISNKGIAQLLPIIMRSPIAYNQISGRFEFAVNLENFRSRYGLLSPEPPRTPPEQTGRRFFESKEDRDSGLGDSPPQLNGPVAHSSSGDPGPSTEMSDMEWEFPTRGRSQGAVGRPPRQWSEREEETGRMFQLVLGEEIGQASTSSQQKPLPQSSYVITSLVRYGIPTRPTLLTTNNDRKSSSREFSARSPCFEDVNILGMKSEEHDKSEQGACSQVSVRALEGAQADDESMPIEIRDQQVRYRPSVPCRRRGEMTYRPSSIPFPTAWNNSIFSDLGVSEDSPKDTENICNEEHKEQKVIDKSDQKSSDECSEAKSQESESPEKKHGGGLFCKKGMPILAKLSPFKRHSVERDTMCSSKSDLVYHVTEKPPVPKEFFLFPGRRKAKSNPPSEVTSPTHEGGPEWQQRLSPDQREELRPLLSPELQKKLDSNSLSPEDEQLKHLLYTPSGQEKMKKNFESQEENLRRSVNAQLPANPSSKKVDRDSGFCSMASPAVPHKGSVSSKVKECDLQQAKYMSKALGKN